MKIVLEMNIALKVGEDMWKLDTSHINLSKIIFWVIKPGVTYSLIAVGQSGFFNGLFDWYILEDEKVVEEKWGGEIWNKEARWEKTPLSALCIEGASCSRLQTPWMISKQMHRCQCLLEFYKDGKKNSAPMVNVNLILNLMLN